MGDLLVIKAEACKHPVAFLEEVMAGPLVNPLLRVQAAGMLAKMPKYATRYLSRTIDLKPPNSIDEAREQIKQIIGLERLKYIGCDEAKEQIDRLNAFIEAERGTDFEHRIEALEEDRRQRGPPQTVIEIESQMPDLPGTNVLIPPRTITGPGEPAKGDNPWSPDKDKP
jgi:hypothetical protein